jgi:hypothetical protein
MNILAGPASGLTFTAPIRPSVGLAGFHVLILSAEYYDRDGRTRNKSALFIAHSFGIGWTHRDL